jgi:hypothetical protein
MANIESGGGLLTPLQQLPTSGARAAEVFMTDEGLFLGVPQLARDVAGEPPYMNGGDSDIEAPIYRWQDGRFVEHEALPLPGGEDLEYFEIDGRRFLAAAGIRTGKGPYDLDTHAVVYERIAHAWVPLQDFPAFAAKQWVAFSFDSRHFLALAQGVVVDGMVPRHPRDSRLFEWNGERFEPFQTLDGQWGYNFAFVSFEGERYLAYADHVSGSSVLRWNGETFAPLQSFDENGGRAFRFFEANGALWMLHANLLKHTTLYRFDGAQFVATQTLGGVESIKRRDAIWYACALSPARLKHRLSRRSRRFSGGGTIASSASASSPPRAPPTPPPSPSTRSATWSSAMP